MGRELGLLRLAVSSARAPDWNFTPPPSEVLLRGPMRPHAGAVSLTLGSIRAGHIRRSGATLATSFLNLIASLPPDYGADSIGGLVERWYYVIGLTLGPGRSLMHGVAPQMCGRVSQPIVRPRSRGSLPRLPLAASVAPPNSPPNRYRDSESGFSDMARCLS